MVAAQEPKALDPAGRNSTPLALVPLDSALLLALSILFILVALRQIQWDITPVEDASMLLRYAQHFSQGYGIRWNIHQPPVDGATDFLYTVAIGALAHLTHIGVATASRLLNLAAHLGTVLLMFLGARLILGANRWIAFAVAAYLIPGPAIGMTNGCFGAPVFAFLLLACWCAGLWYARFRPSRPPSWITAICMSSLGLLAGLTRPEGVLIAIMLLLATLYLTLEATPTLSPGRPWKRCIPLLVSFTLIFAIFGGAYFAWRWKYFGYPLPNPFYIKGNGHIYPSSLHYSTMNLLHILYPALPLLPLGWLSPRTRRLALALTALLVVFDLMWLLLINSNNHFGRFQYAIVPLVLMTLAALGSQAALLFSARPPTFPRWIIPAAGTLALVSSMIYASQLYFSTNAAWGMRSFATRLQPLASRGYTMAVTEAGALPFYSQWQTIDGIGLNDTYIAHHPQQHLSPEYLDRFHPEIIMVHIDSSLPGQFVENGIGSPPEPSSGGWNQQFMSFYAKTHGYTLAAVWGSDPCNLHIYWVRPGFPDYPTVVSDLRDHPYYFLDNGLLAHDFRNQLDSLQNCALPAGPA